MPKSNKPFTRQKGAVLILMAFIMGLGVLAYMLNTFDPQRLRLEQNKKTYQSLNAAKEALIAWSVNHQYAPGQMPWPDRHLDPGIYDGSSDCATTAFQYSNLLGQLPSLPDTSPCLDKNNGLSVYAGFSTYPSLGQDFRDAQGNKLWYAVSRNLVRKYDAPTSDPIINPNIINAPTYQWLQVLDRNGNLVSDRVAAVILAPGDALTGQNRAGAADASQFLDGFQIGAAVFNNRGYATEDEDFIMGDDSRNVSPNDPTFLQPYHFNDKLVYITIDELMAALEKRVGEQVRTSLKAYQDANGYYPYAAQLGTATNFSCELTNSAGVTGLTSGFLPVDNQSCTYTRIGAAQTSLICAQSVFDASTSGITQVRFDRTSGGTLTAVNSGLCVRNSTTRCTCTGSGSCGSGASTVTCTSTNCSTNGMMGNYRITNGKFRFRSAGCAFTTFPTKTAASCSNSNSVITCNTSNGTFSSCGDLEFGTLLPSWFKTNQWQNYVYYRLTRPALASLTVGTRNAEAVLVTVGRPINAIPFAASKVAAQVRPSCNTLNNYLDSAENANGDAVYDATSMQRNASYNDQTLVVEP
jgi:hypothetical protein